MTQSDEDGQSTPKRDEVELAHEVRVTLLEAVRKAAEAGDGLAAHQLACAYEVLTRRKAVAAPSSAVSSAQDDFVFHSDEDESEPGMPVIGESPLARSKEEVDRMVREALAEGRNKKAGGAEGSDL